ncbi:MFS transporter [Saccharopolyspora rhizosphaerae]|uniref:MFS transporter n=1 Tax=Saccharopolyspora rhizosphaerae TaxID=2492662 RepID=UPI001F45E78F|nr:MFS transporter [Saccharopolyspora rhizosphaerae]
MLRARNAVAVVFALNGFAMASWMSRIPEVRDALSVTPGELGRMLLAISVGSLLALPLSGSVVHRFGARAVIVGGAAVTAVGLGICAAGSGVVASVPLTAAGLFAFGLGTGLWDVSMNIDGAAVEREIGRTIMPRFHAGFSFGTVIGAGVGAACAGLGVPVAVHLVVAAIVVGAGPALAAPSLLPAQEREEQASAGGGVLRAWAEPRTLLVGLMVLAMALTEGTANDWLAVALVDGYAIPPWLGAVGFAVFLSAMTAGRVVGTVLLDRFGRTQVLWATMVTAGVGVLLVVFGGWLPLVFLGAAIWGLGASLGFPVGMSAAADDPARAAARVSVVSTIGYTAFLAGPPLLGYLADHVGTLHALLLVAVLLIPSALAVPAARPSDQADAA